MATRNDLFEELHLAPVWRLRAAPGLGHCQLAPAVPTTMAPAMAPAAAMAPAMAPAAAMAPAIAPATLTVPLVAEAATGYAVAEPELRRARIAALQWPDFAADVAACTACALCRTRKKTVPGVGDVEAEWLFVGEAPGADEDAKGEPFVGQAGRLLDNMLAAIGLARGANVYIANVQKCRPPGNRTPVPAEIEACQPYLDRQIALLRPRLIVALGKSAATTLLNYDATIASLRGRVHRYRGLPLVVTYHPAYLLRTLADKAKAWEDLLFAKRTMAQAREVGAATRAGDADLA